MVAATRLDRLISLLETGSTAAVKQTAAQQLGAIAALRVRGGSSAGEQQQQPKAEPGSSSGEASTSSTSTLATAQDGASAAVYAGIEGDWHEALYLLAKVLPHLRSKSWDTRVAAAQAVEVILRGAGIWDPSAILAEDGGDDDKVAIKKEEEDSLEDVEDDNDDQLRFENFSLAHLLATGTKLLASAGKEYTLPTGSVAERLAAAKRSLKELGLDLGGGSSGSVAGGSDDGMGLDVEAELRQGEEASAAAEAKEAQQQRQRSALGGPSASSSNSSTPLTASPRLGRPSTSAAPALSLPSDDVAGTTDEPSDIDLSKLSARERNQLKRKRKMQGSGSVSGGMSIASPVEKTRVIDAAPASSNGGAGGATGLRIKTSSGGPAAEPSAPSAIASPSTPTTGGAAATSAASAREARDLVPRSRAEWPFSLVAQVLSADLFSPQWEVRHGAALGLRELVRVQGKACGMRVPPQAVAPSERGADGMQAQTQGLALTAAQRRAARKANERLHARWTEDMAIRLLSVLSLDRLGDFIFDHVVAPVREVTSQVLAALMRVMPEQSVQATHAVLKQMVLQAHLLGGDKDASSSSSSDDDDVVVVGVQAHGDRFQTSRLNKGYSWEVRHAGLLGLKYELSLRRKDLGAVKGEGAGDVQGSLREIVKLAKLGLRDDDDDIRGVAASMLIPVASDIVAQLPDLLPHLLHQLWDCLQYSRDDLSSSLSSVMDLLSVLAQDPSVVALMQSKKAERTFKLAMPLLYPYFRQKITSVRASTVKAVQTFLDIPGTASDWVDDRLFRLLFQNMVVEEKAEIRASSASAWATLVRTLGNDPAWLSSTIRQHIPSFFAILMTPLGQRFDASLFFRPSFGAATNGNANGHDADRGGLTQDLSLLGVDTIMRGRLGAAQALGEILALWPETGIQPDFEPLLEKYLSAQSALQRCLAAAVLQEWAEATARHGRELIKSSDTARKLNAQIIGMLEGPAPATYAEMTVLLSRTQTECQALCNMFVRDGKLAKDAVPVLPTEVDATGQDATAFSIDTAKAFAGESYPRLLGKVSNRNKKTAQPLLEQKYRVVVTSIGFYDSAKAKQDTQMLASLAAAAISLGGLPDKLNPIIRSVMNSVKFEENADLQERSARAVAHLIDVCCRPGAKSNPSGKIVKNLCAFICQDTSITPVFDAANAALEGIAKEPVKEASDGPPTEGQLIRRGAKVALSAVARHFGAVVFVKVPALWDGIAAALTTATAKKSAIDFDNACAGGLGQGVLDGMHVLQAILPSISSEVMPEVLALLPKLTVALQSKYALMRSSAAQTIAALAVASTSATMLHIINEVFPLLNDATSVRNRQGAVEAVSITVGKLQLDVLPYLIFMIVPLLGRMADPDDDVRLLATSSFGTLVKMVPLEAGLPDPVGFPSQLLERRQEQRSFLEQLLGNNKVQPYTIPVALNVELRKYQQDGVNWMAFLAKYQLHGVLCDDMGLGKTLQTIAIMASKHFERAKRFEETGSADSKHLPSLVVCPPTLTGHWVHEIRKYATNLKPLLYVGLPTERSAMFGSIAKHNVVVTSYDVVRNDFAALSQLAFNYCVLDEGHIIKNAKTKTTKAVKSIQANHRLLLSGTPIQNSVLELWSLFDFLMPGFLGSEKAFHEKFSKPILATRDGKASAKEREAAALALEALHKQVLPFVLRRLKDDVLDDLPPKIIQDIECDLGDIQRELYDDYQKGQKGPDEGEDKQHVFQTLQYLRKLVNHPMLVMDPKNPKHIAIKQKADKQGGLQSITHAPKLLALRQLLHDCGIGQTATDDDAVQAAVSQHRVLVFCQMKQMLDIIEHDLFKKHMLDVTYMRLDGSVSADKRFDIVQTFNADPSIDVLLLTTQVGGLGLTLTGADTVIFVEHDWNPMKDLQAMDRAHRLGQKKVVNVYRLITRNTLEAKIMGLQRFKLNLANTVVNQQNADALEAMDSDQVLDLFGVGEEGAAAEKDVKQGKMTQKELLEGISNLPDTEEAEYAGMQQWAG